VTGQPLRVLIADDHALVRAGISLVVSSHPAFVVCGEAATGAEAVAQYDALRPDVMLMDLQLPGLDGIAALERIRAQHPDARVLMLTTFDLDEDIERALRAGARGYLLKDAKAEELTNALRDVCAGKTVALRQTDAVVNVHLSMRDLSVLRLLADGKSEAEISAALAMPEDVVRALVTLLFEKLGVTSRMEAVAAARRRGLVGNE